MPKNSKQHDREATYVLNNRFKMRNINPITKAQEKVFRQYDNGKNLLLHGSAGTGKTYISLFLGLKDIMEKNHCEKIVIFRSAVQSREQGFLPGTLKEKTKLFETPYENITNDLFGRKDAYEIMKQKNMIEFVTTSFIRGLTFDNTVMLVDESQNMTYEELRTIITRVGENSKIIFCGDTRQDDLRNTKNHNETSGLNPFMNILQNVDSFDVVEFGKDDIVRSGLVKDFIIQEELTMGYA